MTVLTRKEMLGTASWNLAFVFLVLAVLFALLRAVCDAGGVEYSYLDNFTAWGILIGVEGAIAFSFVGAGARRVIGGMFQ